MQPQWQSTPHVERAGLNVPCPCVPTHSQLQGNCSMDPTVHSTLELLHTLMPEFTPEIPICFLGPADLQRLPRGVKWEARLKLQDSEND